jgi:pteridine reductase
MLLTDKSVLVTGAANRLGAQIARTLHQNGANLIIHYRASADAAEMLVAELNQMRANSAISLCAELGDVAEIEELANHAISAFDGMHILINNASSFYPTKFGEIDQQAWDDLTASNYRAPLFLSQACYPALKQSSGCIINLIDIYASRQGGQPDAGQIAGTRTRARGAGQRHFPGCNSVANRRDQRPTELQKSTA